jgi:pyruvate dehydrogenase E2 component (dihydrolipoamide acetyltransferase)
MVVGGSRAGIAESHRHSRPGPSSENSRRGAQGDQRVPPSGMRRVIAERLLASKTQLPHFYLLHRGRCEVPSGLRKELNSANESAGLPKLTVNDL